MPKVIKVTKKLLKDNPEIAAQGAVVGDTVEVSEEETTLPPVTPATSASLAPAPSPETPASAETDVALNDSAALNGKVDAPGTLTPVGAVSEYVVQYHSATLGPTTRVFSVSQFGPQTKALAEEFAATNKGTIQ